MLFVSALDTLQAICPHSRTRFPLQTTPWKHTCPVSLLLQVSRLIPFMGPQTSHGSFWGQSSSCGCWMSRVTTTEGTSGWKGEERDGGGCAGRADHVPRTSLIRLQLFSTIFFNRWRSREAQPLAPAHRAGGLELGSDRRRVAYLCQQVCGSRASREPSLCPLGGEHSWPRSILSSERFRYTWPHFLLLHLGKETAPNFFPSCWIDSLAGQGRKWNLHSMVSMATTVLDQLLSLLGHRVLRGDRYIEASTPEKVAGG